PAIGAPLFDILYAAVAADLAVVLTGQAKRLVKLLEELIKRELRRRRVWVAVLQQRQTHHDVRHPFTASGVRDLLHVFHETRYVQKLRHWTHLSVFFVDHHCRADAAVRVTTARNLAPLGIRTVNEIRKVRKGAHQRKREPIARGFGNTNLVLHVVRQVRERVTLLQTTLRSDLFVTAGKRNRLERKERNLLRIVECKANDRTNLVVVDTVDERRNQNDLN